MDTTIISLILSSIGAVVGWFFGRAKKKAEDSNALLTSLDTQSNAFSKQMDMYEALADKYIKVFEENVALRETVAKQQKELDSLRSNQDKLKSEVESLRATVAALLSDASKAKRL